MRPQLEASARIPSCRVLMKLHETDTSASVLGEPVVSLKKLRLCSSC